MSIYRRRDWKDLDDMHHFAAPPKAGAPENSPSRDSSAAMARDWLQYRKALPAEQLLPSTKRFLDQLPPEAYPGALATHYPRIVNLIAIEWNGPNDCSAYLDELLVDRRDGRQGFPAAVTRDLEKLRDYWSRGGRR